MQTRVWVPTLILVFGLEACGDDTDPQNEAPVIQILAPAEGDTFAYGETISLDASATDPEDGTLSGVSFHWSSSLDGALATGPTLDVHDLSFGVHTLTATAMDNEGLTAAASVTVEVSELITVASWMTGHFSSAQQSIDDPTYYDITLDMARIWPDATDGIWIYVEQSVTGSDPYRQRVYRLFEDAGQVQDEIYRIPNENAYVGAWATPEVFANLTGSDLTLKPGCDVYFHWVDSAFEGGTDGKDCFSDLNGASYATTEIVMGPELLTSWDQGWTAADAQVWGPTAGPYLFDKHDDYPLR